MLNNLAHSEDPTRIIVGASWDGSVGTLERITDAVAYNRYYGWYYGSNNDWGKWLDDTRAIAGGHPFAISEYGFGGNLRQHQLNPTTHPSLSNARKQR